MICHEVHGYHDIWRKMEGKRDINIIAKRPEENRRCKTCNREIDWLKYFIENWKKLLDESGENSQEMKEIAENGIKWFFFCKNVKKEIKRSFNTNEMLILIF